jgi:hypothetical protein
VVLTIAGLGCAVAAWSNAPAQQPDTARPGRDRVVVVADMPAMLTIQAPTLVVVAPEGSRDTLSVWTAGSAVAAATGMQLAHLAPRGRLVDRRHAAVSVLPPDLVVGFILAAPGIRPSLVRGAVSRAALEDSARAFLRLYRAPPR